MTASHLTPLTEAQPDGFAQLRARVAAAIGIAHHVRGRIRLRLETEIEELPKAAADLKHFQALFEGSPGVRSIRVNPLARSCTVEYDPAVIPGAAWNDFLAGTQSTAAVALETLLRQKYRELADGLA